MTTAELTDLVTDAVRATAPLLLTGEYDRWSAHWLTGEDRTERSARRACAHIDQWAAWRGTTYATKACSNAAIAADFLARALKSDAKWLRDECALFARAACRHAHLHYTGETARVLARADNNPKSPPLVFDDWNYGPGGVRRGRSYDPGEV